MFDYSDASIRKKLRLLLSMGILFMLFVAGVILLINSFFSNRTVLNNEVSALAEVTTLAIVPSLMFDDRLDAQETLETLKAHKNIVYAAVLQAGQQQPFASYMRSGNQQLTQNIDGIINDCQKNTFSFKFLHVCKPLLLDEVEHGKILLVISLHNIYQRLIKELGIALLGLLLASLLIFYILGIVSKKMTDPILELLAISEEISQSGNYEKRASIYSEDEIGRLGVAFNSMLGKIQFWHDALKDQKENLEITVEERTRDLKKTKNEALLLADQAQKASIAKSDFLSVMSHEIRTPLNAILGFADLLKETALDEQQKEYIKVVNQSGNSLLNQVNDILDFSKIEAGKMEVDLLWFDLYELLISVLASNRHASSKKSILLKHEIEEGLPRYLYGDEQKIRQILYNLLSNAIKFTEQGSVSLSVKTELTDNAVKRVVFSILDTGVGISEQKQATLFDPFTQEDASITRKYGGTGLGLAIVEKMTGLLGGEIFLQSSLGEGAEFTVSLPLERSLAGSDREQVKAPLSIVLFENEADSVLSVQLQQLGYEVDLICSSKYQLSQSQADLMRKYSLVLFAQDCLEQAKRWHEWESEKNQNLSLVYCTDELTADNLEKDLGNLSVIKISRDGLEMVEQINRLINDEPSSTTFETVLAEKHILVVEDNPVNLLMVENILKKSGLIIHSATNGQLAVELYKTRDFSLILMDCQMPVMDGFSATREIRLLEQQSGKHTPVIALTANAFKEDREACMDAGMDDFLCKPFKKKQLYEVMEPWLKKEGASNGIIEAESGHLTENILDSAIITELMEMDEEGSKEFISQISATFFTNAQQLMQQIEIDFSKKAITNIAKAAHQLKSSSMNVAAKRLSGLYKQLETTVIKLDSQETKRLWKSIIEEHRLVEMAYKDLLQS